MILTQKYKFCPESPAYGTTLTNINFSGSKTRAKDTRTSRASSQWITGRKRPF